jgi:cytochrome c oxidase subunit 2
LPVGVPVAVTLKSNDVIHSFWVPNLAGKQDLIPGRVTDVQLLPRKTGLYRGQCAEFCGVQHAHMALDVTVESKADFQRWYAQLQLAPRAGHAAAAGRLPLCHHARMQLLPQYRRHAGQRPGRARPHPFRQPAEHRRRDAADESRQSLRLGRRSAVAKARQPHADDRLAPNELHAVVAYLETLK